MNKLFTKLKKVDKKLKAITKEIAGIHDMPYYKAFNRHKELQEDLTALKAEKNRLTAKKIELLDLIEDRAGVEKLNLKKEQDAKAA